ncbi:glycosyltransferase N-terminal domain-containing protein [Aliamphritea spongicola]|nr:glycosyltransferase N-terminal domain-containing protein [Aliamphritea spongicola]
MDSQCFRWETIAIAPMVERILAEYPQMPVLMTTMTPTGSERVTSMFVAGSPMFTVLMICQGRWPVFTGVLIPVPV